MNEIFFHFVVDLVLVTASLEELLQETPETMSTIPEVLNKYQVLMTEVAVLKEGLSVL